MRIDVETALTEYKNSVYIVAYSICNNIQDAEDVTQETFIRYHLSRKQFDNQEHIRSWLLKVAINLSKDTMKSFWHQNRVSLEKSGQHQNQASPVDEHLEVRNAIMMLPEKYRIVLHLYYFEDYSTQEIAKILRISDGTARIRLHRGRNQLKERLDNKEKENGGTA